MSSNTSFRIASFGGDGIGPEVMRSAQAVLEAASGSDFRLAFCDLDGGAGLYRDTGTALPDDSFAEARDADAILFGAMGLPSVRNPDGTEVVPQLDLRFRLGLYAGVRPVKALPGGFRALADPRAEAIDLVIVRESIEGLFASRGKGVVEDDRVARDTMVITRDVCEPLFDFSFRLAQRRKARGGKGLLTCVDKANVFTSMAFFRKLFDERAAGFDGIEARHHYVDAMALDLVRKPWEFDVMVMENMFGDILSDLGAALIGGMGMAPSADIGDSHALFQPAHGTAPDITGQGLANPFAMIQSAAMMLDWLADRHDVPACEAAAMRIDRAVQRVIAGGKVRPTDLGGSDGTAAITDAVIAAL